MSIKEYGDKKKQRDMKDKLYVVLVSESYIRDAQMLNFESFPDDFNFDDDDAVWEYACDPMNDCWSDCYGSIFVDVVRATSDEDAIDFIAQLSGYDKRVLTSICIGE